MSERAKRSADELVAATLDLERAGGHPVNLAKYDRARQRFTDAYREVYAALARPEPPVEEGTET